MIAYWLRIGGAWLLLRFATSLVKDAEELVRRTADAKPVSTDVVVDAEVVA